MTTTQSAITILLCILATQITRWVPFLFLRKKSDIPAFIIWLGKVLPSAVFGMLIVYCLKDISFTESPHGLPELAAILITVLLHLWKKSMLLSIALGTAAYMILIRII